MATTQTLFDLFARPDVGTTGWAPNINTIIDLIDKYFGLNGTGDPNTNDGGGPTLGDFVGQVFVQTDGVDVDPGADTYTGRIWVCTVAGTGGGGGTAEWVRLSLLMGLEAAFYQTHVWQKSQRGKWVDAAAYVSGGNMILIPADSNFFHYAITGSITIDDPDLTGVDSADALTWIVEFEQSGTLDITFIGGDYIFQSGVEPTLTQIAGYVDVIQFMQRPNGKIEVTSLLGFTLPI